MNSDSAWDREALLSVQSMAVSNGNWVPTKRIPQGKSLVSPVPGSGTQSWAGNSQGGCHRTVASHPGVVCSWPQSLPVQALALLWPGEQDLGVRAVTEGGEVWVGTASVPVLLALNAGPCGNGCSVYPVASPPTFPSPLHLVELGQHRASLLLFLVLLHLGLQPPVVLQGLLAPFHCHVEAWEYAAEPVGHSMVGNRLVMWGYATTYSKTCAAHLLCASPMRF